MEQVGAEQIEFSLNVQPLFPKTRHCCDPARKKRNSVFAIPDPGTIVVDTSMPSRLNDNFTCLSVDQLISVISTDMDSHHDMFSS